MTMRKICRKGFINIVLLTLIACNVSTGIEKRLLPELTLRYNGLRYDSYKLLLNELPMKSNDIRYGEKLSFQLHNISGLTSENNLVFPNMSLKIIKKSGEEVEAVPDILNGQQLTVDSARVLTAHAQFTPGIHPPGEYELLISLKDKKGKGNIEGKIPLVLKKNDIQMKVTSSGLSAQDIMLLSTKGPIENNQVTAGGKVILYLTNLEGFKTVNDLIFPGGSISLIDGQSNQVKLAPEDVFTQFSETGANSTVTKAGFHLSLPLTDLNLRGDKSVWIFKIWDKRSSAAISVEIPLQII